MIISKKFFKLVSVKEVVEVMEKKRSWTAEQTHLFCSILADPVTTFMLTLGRVIKKRCHKRGI